MYAKYGAKCVLAARGPKVLELAEQLKSEGYEATGVQVDVSDYKSVERIVEVAEKIMNEETDIPPQKRGIRGYLKSVFAKNLR